MQRRIPFYEFCFMFLMGCFIYSLLEITFRGHTHWTMTLTGGIAGVLLYGLEAAAPPHTLFLQSLAGALLITATEMVVGVIDNLIFQWNVWDYTNMPLNVYGQICLPFTALWYLLSIPALLLCRLVQHRFQRLSAQSA